MEQPSKILLPDESALHPRARSDTPAAGLATAPRSLALTECLRMHSRLEAQGRPRPPRLRFDAGKKYSINPYCRLLSRTLPAQSISALTAKRLPEVGRYFGSYL
jgi:hypothetical protein